MSLQDLARIAVRRSLGDKIAKKAPLLNIPTCLRKSLFLVGDLNRKDLLTKKSNLP